MVRVLKSVTVALLLASAGTAHAQCELAKIFAEDGAFADFFGTSLSVSGSTLVVGAPGSDAAYVYSGSGNDWRFLQKLVPPDAPRGRLFGESVSISGETIAVGARGDDQVGSEAGAVYVFARGPSRTFTLRAKLFGSGQQPNDRFGAAVAIDADTLAVGQDPIAVGTGDLSVWVFARRNGVWTEEARFDSSLPGVGWGDSVAVHGDRIVVGDPTGNGVVGVSGTAHVFARNGGSWSLEATLQASDGANGDAFGETVALDGDTAVAGASRRNEIRSNAGSAYVFVRSGTAWSQQAKLLPSDPEPGLTAFGRSVALDVGAGLLTVGAIFENGGGLGTGAAYVFLRDGDAWKQASKLEASDAEPVDIFGSAIGTDRGLVFVGAHFADGAGDTTGAAYVYDNSFLPYGEGLAGSGGFLPVIYGRGCPRVGETVSIDVGRGLGGASGFLAVGFESTATPFAGGTIYIKPPFAAVVSHVLGGFPGSPADGRYQLSLPPNDPDLIGRTFFVQAGYVDPGAPAGFSLSGALKWTVRATRSFSLGR